MTSRKRNKLFAYGLMAVWGVAVSISLCPFFCLEESPHNRNNSAIADHSCCPEKTDADSRCDHSSYILAAESSFVLTPFSKLVALGFGGVSGIRLPVRFDADRILLTNSTKEPQKHPLYIINKALLI